MHKILLVIAVLALVCGSSGCSVFMALHGKKDADIGMIEKGQDRSFVVAKLGQPVRTDTTDTGRIDIFELQRGNAPSAGRAVAHGALDVLTFGIWEVAGTPIEAVQGETFTFTVTYDHNDKVAQIHTSKGDAKSNERKKENHNAK